MTTLMFSGVRSVAATLRQRAAAIGTRHQGALLKSTAAVALVIFGATAAMLAMVAVISNRVPGAISTGSDSSIGQEFVPPDEATIPAGPGGESIRRGKAIFDDPRTFASAFVGNSMACRNCHLDSGRKPNSSPMWAAWVRYPLFRTKDNAVNTMEDRIQGCFRYSMNAPNSPSGGPPPAGSDVYRQLESYFHWLATGAATGSKLAGSGYPTPPLTGAGYDPGRGAPLFQQKCSGCHGADGEGAKQPDGKVIYPPLWGPRSYNWGAGMARVDLATGFIKANMPFDQPGSLSDQDAWDIAAFVDSHERPKDPRQSGSVAENAKTNFAGQKTFYGRVIGGKILGSGVLSAR